MKFQTMFPSIQQGTRPKLVAVRSDPAYFYWRRGKDVFAKPQMNVSSASLDVIFPSCRVASTEFLSVVMMVVVHVVTN